MGRDDALHKPGVAVELGEPEPVLRLPTGNPTGDLQHQHDRVDPGAAPEGDEEARCISDHRIGAQGPVPRPHESERALYHARPGLAQRSLPPVRRFPGVGAAVMQAATYTVNLTLPHRPGPCSQPRRETVCSCTHACYMTGILPWAPRASVNS